MRRWIAATLLLLAFASSHAEIITFDPNDYAPGTNISHAQPGVSVAHYGWPTGYPRDNPVPPTRTYDVVATRCSDVYYSCLSEDGLGFGMSSILEEYYSCTFPNRTCIAATYLEFTFDDPTNVVSFVTNWSRDSAGYFAYDISGALISYCWTACGFATSPNPHEEGYMSVVALTRNQRDIHRIIVGSLAGSGFINSMQFSVPEPSTLAIMGLGLLGLGVRRRRKA